jgi:hypothetical protein
MSRVLLRALPAASLLLVATALIASLRAGAPGAGAHAAGSGLGAALALALVVPAWRLAGGLLARTGGPPRAVALLLLLLAAALPPALSEAWLRRAPVAEGRHARAGFHPFLQNRNRPGDAELGINAHGFRGEEIALAKPEGTLRVAVLGGSTVLCARVPWEESHVRRLELALRAQYPDRRIEVINAGAHWYTSQHSLIHYLFWVREFEPDVVVYWHAINDLVRSFSPAAFADGPYRADQAHFYGSLGRMAHRWFADEDEPPRRREGPALLEAFRAPPSAAAGPPRRPPVRERVPVDDWASLAAHERNLRLLIDRLEADGVRLVVCTQPSLYRTDLSPEEHRSLWFPDRLCNEEGRAPDLPSMVRGMERFNDSTRRVCEERGVPCLDLAAVVPKDGAHFLDDCHYTGEGNRVVAETLREFLVRRRWLER